LNWILIAVSYKLKTEKSSAELVEKQEKLNIDVYDTSKRHPAWTDRILYRCDMGTQIQCLCYDTTAWSDRVSDHWPVYAIYKIQPNICEENRLFCINNYSWTVVGKFLVNLAVGLTVSYSLAFGFIVFWNNTQRREKHSS
jgi:hypothetical protein